MIVVGIDPSLSCTSLAFFGDGGYEDVASVRVKTMGTGLNERFARYYRICSQVSLHLDGIVHEIESGSERCICLIEGYSFGSKYSSEHLAEFGAMLRDTALKIFGDDVWEVAPTTLKKFVCGKGNVKKAAMVSRITKSLGVALETDDEADAIGLAHLGWTAMACDHSGLTKVQLECIKKVFGDELTDLHCSRVKGF